MNYIVLYIANHDDMAYAAFTPDRSLKINLLNTVNLKTFEHKKI